MTEMSDAEVFGDSAKEMSDADVFGAPAQHQDDLPANFLDRFNAGNVAQQAEQAAVRKTPSGLELMSTPEGRTKLWNAIKSYPAHFLESTLETLETPGDVYSGKADLTTPEGMDRALNLGVLIGLGRLNKLPLTAQTAGEAIRAGEGISRIKQLPDGSVVQQPVGDLPQPQDFSNAAKILTDQPTGRPSLFAKFGETGRAEKNSSIEAPPGAQSLPDQVSTRPEPSGSSTTRPTTPESTTAGPATIFGDLELGAIDGSSNKRILQGSNDYKALLAAAERNKPKLSDALQRVTDGVDGASVYGVRVKDEPGLVEKIETKGRAPSTISDYLGARIVADTPEAMNEVLARFESTGAVIEAENFVHSPKAGYRAYHLQVGLGDGTSAEIQVVPRPIADKISETHAIRQPFKRMAEASPEGMARFKEAMELAVKISDDSWASAKGWPESKIRDLNNPADAAQTNLRRMWQEDGIHPAEAVHDAQADAFLKHEITAPHEEIKPDPETAKVLDDTGGAPGSLSAAITPPEQIPLAQQPPRPAGSLIASAQAAGEKLFDVGRDIQMKLAPMARGSVDSMSTVKDYMNSMRRNAWDSSRIDTDIVDRFSAEQRERMARAMEEESLSLRLGEPESAREHQGLATLEPEERAAVEQLDQAQQLAWLRARDLGMVEGDGIRMHFPRMAIGAKGDSEIGKPPSLTQMYGIRKNSPFTKQRQYMEAEETEKALKAKYGDQAKIAWDIRAVNLATKMLEDAVAGRTLIKNIQEVGKRTGDETVAEGFKPGEGWFTVDHPAFQKWRPKLGDDGKAVMDTAAKPVFESVPIYVRGDFEGPIRAALWGKTGEAYQGMMALKGKTMGLIMNSPMIHNLVELGRAFPAIAEQGGVKGIPTLPIRVVKTYVDGYRAKNDVGMMHEAIDAGLVPIGKRFFNQDINAIMEAPDLTPGRSFTAKVLSAVPGLFDEGAGTAVKQAIDKAGDFWHNTLLWDRIADLQMGLYTNFRGDLVGKGMDQQTASRIAAHWANRYAGALPKEAMSEAATKVSNFMFFSRSFTFGNLGVMKDMLTGLPKDVLAQIERDAGFRAGSIEGADVEGAKQMAVTSAKSIARRQAMTVVGLDIGLMIAGNSVLQSALNVLRGTSWSQEEHEYLRRFSDVINDVKAHPLSLLNPIYVGGLPSRLSATHENEPGKGDRVMIGTAKDGTAIYARNPIGKIGEEFTGYFDSPLDMMRKKEGTILRPLMQIYSNDAGFGRKIYDPHAETLGDRAGAIWAMAKHLVESQLPMGQLHAAHDLVTGEGDKFVNLLQVAGPLAGVTFSKGAPGGPAVGEMYDVKGRREFAQQQAMPDLRRQIQRGDIAGAQKAMGELGMDASYQRWVVKTSLDPRLRLSPRSMKDFYNSATPEQRARFERARQPPQP